MRLFVAIELPEGERRRLAELPDKENWIGLERVDFNWVRPENLHITLKFLGSVPDDRVAEIREALRDVRSPGPLKIRVGRAAFLPRQGPMRVFVSSVDGDVDALRELQSEIERVLEPLGFARERRAFSPHVTLARPRRERDVPGEFREDVEEHPGTLGPAFPVESFTLMNSDLNPGGPVYTPVERFTL